MFEILNGGRCCTLFKQVFLSLNFKIDKRFTILNLKNNTLILISN